MAAKTHLETFREIIYSDLCGFTFNAQSLREAGHPIPPDMNDHTPERPAFSIADGSRQDGSSAFTTLKLTNHMTGAVVIFDFDQFGQLSGFALQPTKSNS